MDALVAGALSIAVAAFLGGATGFGYSVVATPLLLTSGFTLPFVITVNLTLGLATRVVVAYRFRSSVNRTRTTLLIVGSIPGLWLGAQILKYVDPDPIKIVVGVLVMAMAVIFALRAAPTALRRQRRGVPAAAGLAGGFLGAISSLNGVPAALLLTHDGANPTAFLADLAVYFVVSNAIALAILLRTGTIVAHAFPAALIWLPGALLGNAAGIALGPRMPGRWFRTVTLGLVIVTGALTVATSL